MTNQWEKIKKRKSTLPDPPQEASENITRSVEVPPVPPQRPSERSYTRRYIKRTGRVVQFATRVTAEFNDQIREIAQHEDSYLAEVLERMLAAYLRELRNKRG